MTTLNLSNSLVQTEVLGRGLASPLREDPGTGDFVATEAAANIKNCIQDLMLTKVGERVMNEDFGTAISSSLFESQESVIDAVPVQIVDAIKRFEPRVYRVRARGVAVDENTVKINVSWVLRSTGMRDSLVYPYYLNPSKGGFAQ